MNISASLLYVLQNEPSFIPVEQQTKAWVGSYNGVDLFITYPMPERKRRKKKGKKRGNTRS